MRKPSSESPSPSGSSSIVDALIADYAPVSETIDISLPPHTLTFRLPQTYGAINTLYGDAAKFGQRMMRPLRNPDGSSVPNSTRDTAPSGVTSEDFAAAYIIHELSEAPKFTIDEAVRLLHAPWAVKQVMDELNRHRMSISNRVIEAIEEGKDPLAAMLEHAGTSLPVSESESSPAE